MKNLTKLVTTILSFWLTFDAFSQVPDTVFIDLGDEKYKGQQINLNATDFVLVNKMKAINYRASWKKVKKDTPIFKLDAITGGGVAAPGPTCGDPAVQALIVNLVNAKNEKEVKEYVIEGNKILKTLSDAVCKNNLSQEISFTRGVLDFPFNGQLSNNEIVTLTIVRSGLDELPIDVRTYVFDTPEKDRWLVHYGLTYAPSAFSRVSRYHAFADTNSANKYTITRENKNGPKPWDNISATINFTYPFHGNARDIDGGFTGGFGLSTGFEVSGHAGLSMIIGQNIILSSGVVMMQKYKLNGEYKEGDIVKTNLNFEALHTKVWVPELFFTIGFRFGSNPFAAKKTNSEAKKEE